MGELGPQSTAETMFLGYGETSSPSLLTYSTHGVWALKGRSGTLVTVKRDSDLDQCLPLTFLRNMLANSGSVRILIKGGKVVNDDCTHEADVYIENGIIQQVGRELMIPGGAKVIDATGKLVIPGGIDTSTHFHQTFMNATCVDDFYHGTKVMLLFAEGAFPLASSVCGAAPA